MRGGRWSVVSSVRAMKHYVGLDVSRKFTHVCVMDQEQKIIAQTKVLTDPEAIALYLHDLKLSYHRVGLETGTQAQWLYTGLGRAGLPVHCLDARRVKSFLKMEATNKNDRNDAKGIARLMVFGTPHVVHVKSLDAQEKRFLLSSRKSIQSKMIDMELHVRGSIAQFGLEVGPVTRPKWEKRVRELIEGNAFLQRVIEPLFRCIRTLREELANLQREVMQIARQDRVCRLLMTCPGVGPVVSLAFKSTIDIPERFTSSQSVGAALGLTPRQNQSGEVNINGKISKAGDETLRSTLVEAAMVVLRGPRNSWLRAWGLQVAKRRGYQKAAIAVARKLAVVLHRMWVDNTEFRWAREPEAATA
jgi:transposase